MIQRVHKDYYDIAEFEDYYSQQMDVIYHDINGNFNTDDLLFSINTYK